MDKLQVCKEVKELWTAMARITREKKRVIGKCDVYGPWQNYAHMCPAVNI